MIPHSFAGDLLDAVFGPEPDAGLDGPPEADPDSRWWAGPPAAGGHPEPCRDCGGPGEVWHEDDCWVVCPRCGGHGVERPEGGAR